MTLIPTGVLMPVESMLSRFSIGYGHAFATPGKLTNSLRPRCRVPSGSVQPNFNSDIAWEYTGIDVPGRAIYVLDGYTDHMLRYNIDTRTITQLAALPRDAETGQTHIAWDSVNRIVLWIAGGGCFNPTPGSAHAYHPDTNTWETLPLTQPDGLDVTSNHIVFDPIQNAFVIMGCPSGDSGKFFLYRYGNGSGAPADSIPPSVPANLRPR